MRRLRPGDTLAVKSIDRLGRNYREILEQWRILTHERRVGVVVLDMPLLDTRQERDLAGTLTADIVLQLLSYVAETERVLIRQRQAEGIAAARARGQTFGRPRLEVPPAFAEVYRRWNSGEMSSRAAGGAVGHIAADVPALGARNAVGHAMRRSRLKWHSVQSSSPRGRRHRKA